MSVLDRTAIDADLDVLARTLYGEARGEGTIGMQSVASVILNRMRHPRWWGGPSAQSVCLAVPGHDCRQFSTWNETPDNAPNLAAVRAATEMDPAFLDALAVARQALAGVLVDPTGGADHYVVTRLASEAAWAVGRTPTAVIGRHSFYRLEI
jgi:spore germination cell wall hydrolase CwlJ-like protein